MEQNLAALLVVALLVFWAWGYALAALYWFVWPAMKSGVLQARWRTYDRNEEPVRFWLGIAFWIGIAVLLAYTAVSVVLRLWRDVVG